MTNLFRETAPGVFTPWGGERIDDVLYPLNIEWLWDAEQLAAIGLYLPVPAEVPAGKLATSSSVQRVDGVVRFVVTLEDVPREVPVSVTRAQAKIALYNAGLLANAEALVANHPYPPVRIWYSDASVWERTNPYVNSLATELGLSDEQVDDLFVVAALITE
ncbi:MAG: hypothetical protein K0Q69_4068 [Devosia sp.]|jgi:hypothetical protein|nr:hypothetical protein [Devosia sp.]